jgi:hypothetical protein
MRTGSARAVPEDNRLRPADRAAHDWYRFVLSFPPHLVRDYLLRFDAHPGQRVLDPFCGTGTTLVECKKLGIASVGIEANPMAHFASEVKLDWTPDPDELLEHARKVATRARAKLAADGLQDNDAPLFQGRRKTRLKLRTLPPDIWKLLLGNCISPLPLHKTLVLLETLDEREDPKFVRHEKLALAQALISDVSNLQFGPEVGVGPPKTDAPVVAS